MRLALSQITQEAKIAATEASISSHKAISCASSKSVRQRLDCEGLARVCDKHAPAFVYQLQLKIKF